MNMMLLLNQTVILFGILIFFSGLFSFSEVMFTGLSRSQMDRIKRDNPRVLSIWESSPNQILATLLLSNTAVNIAIGVVSTRFAHGLSRHFGFKLTLSVVVVGLCTGFIVLIF